MPKLCSPFLPRLHILIPTEAITLTVCCPSPPQSSPPRQVDNAPDTPYYKIAHRLLTEFRGWLDAEVIYKSP